MKHRIMFGRLRTAAVFTAAAALLGATLTVPATSAAAADASTKYLGIFREASPTTVPSGTVSRYGVNPASVQWFDAWATGNAFNTTAARSLWSQGIMTHFTWEPWNTALSVSDPNQIHLQDIINGRWDNYIRARGAEFAAVGAPIMVRWGHEFNGNWYPWGIVNNNSSPALYISAFRRVHDLVVAAGATNVQWVWCFNNDSSPNTSFNDPAQSYPGDSYVDWIAIDGYNWGLAPSWDPGGNHWRSFESMFASAYSRARSIAPRRPVMIAEVGSSEDGGNKAQWINDMSTALNSGRYPDLKHLVYFDQNKEELWSGTSSAAVQTAFRSWVNQTYMNGTGTELAQVAAQYAGGSDTQPPTTPGNLTASGTTSTSTNLSWNASTDNVGVTGYDILRAPGASGGTFTPVATTTGTSFTNTGLTANTTYRYQVRARDAAGNTSPVSSTVTITTTGGGGDTQPPSIPGNLSASGITSTSTNLSWNVSTDNLGVTGYDILRAPGASGGTFTPVATTTGTSFTNTGLSANTTYRYQVQARDAAGNTSPVSNTVTITTTTGSGGGGGGCSATLTVQNEWNNGYIIQPVRVTNTGTSTITGWTVTFTLPAGHTVTGWWNATLTTNGQTVTARGVAHNSTIAPGGAGEWGFQASRPNGNTALPGPATCTSP